jgi:hypothetical protein
MRKAVRPLTGWQKEGKFFKCDSGEYLSYSRYKTFFESQGGTVKIIT